MKNIFYLFILTLFLYSCGSEVTMSDPVFQGRVDGVDWRASQYQAITNDDGSITLTAISGGDQLVLNSTVADVGAYDITGNNGNYAKFDREISGINSSYTTVSVFAYPDDVVGSIEITEYSGSTITGNFDFNARLNGTSDTINMNRGFFYHIPISGGTTIPDTSCADATAATASAETDYAALTLGDPGYTDACNAYSTALSNEIVICGDNGTLQAIIDSLVCS